MSCLFFIFMLHPLSPYPSSEIQHSTFAIFDSTEQLPGEPLVCDARAGSRVGHEWNAVRRRLCGAGILRNLRAEHATPVVHADDVDDLLRRLPAIVHHREHDARDASGGFPRSRRSRYHRRNWAIDSSDRYSARIGTISCCATAGTLSDISEKPEGASITITSNRPSRGRMTSARRRSGWRTLRSKASIVASRGEPVMRCSL